MVLLSIVGKGKELVISKNSTSYNLTQYCEYVLIDRNQQVNQNLIDSVQWKSFDNNALLFGNQSESYLIRCRFNNKSELEDFVVSAEQPNIDHFEVIDKNFKSLKTTGDIYPWSTREFKESYPSFSIRLEAGSLSTFYLTIHMDEDGIAPFNLYTLDSYYKYYAQREWLFGIFIGLMSVIAIYNLFLYFSIKEKLYLFYATYVISIALAQASMYGNLLGHFYGNFTTFSKIDMIFFTSAVAPFAWLFILKYFEFLVSKRLIRFVVVSLIPFFLVLIVILTNSELVNPTMQVLNASFLYTYVFVIAMGIYGYKSQKVLSIIFISGWICMLSGGTFYVLTNWGILKFYPYTMYLMPFGAALETIILSFALGYRIKLLKHEKMEVRRKLEWQTENTKQLEVDFKEAELQAVRGQVHPHFVFNALNSIQFLIHKPDTDKASQYLTIFSRLIRKSLQFTEMKRISVEEEIAFITDYVEIEQLRFPDPFKFSIEIGESPSLQDASLPPLITQPFIENAIKHAFTKDTKDGELTLRIDLDEKEEIILIEVQDNGKGIDENSNKTHVSKGISITEKRLALLNSEIKESLLSLEIKNIKSDNHKTTGVIVKISLPLH